MEKFYPYINGQFVEPSEWKTLKAPYNDMPLAEVGFASAALISVALDAAVKAKETMRNLPAYKRSEILRQLSSALTADRENLARWLAQEAAKPWKYALAEIDRAAQTCWIASEECKRLGGEFMRLDWTPAGEGKDGIVKYFPAGVVVGISPFNFPLNLAMHKIAPAIAAGCPIVLKPASSTPLSTLLFARLAAQTDLPAGGLNIVPCSREAGDMLVTDGRSQILSFTGSDEVGWKMKARAGKKKTILELGGNAGVIIAESASIENLIASCMTGAFSYQGQICIHAQRFFVHEKHIDTFVQRMKEEIPHLKKGAPEEPDTDFSVMIDAENARRVETWVAEAVTQGATLVAGGKRDGKWMEPTILTGVTPEMKVVSEEVFGPVITVTPFQRMEEAIQGVNSGRFGLQAGIFTDSAAELNAAFEQLEVGGVMHNQVPTLRLDHMPYGGVKDSGLGREGVKYAMMDMLEPRILVK